MSKKTNTDQAIREKFESFSVEPPVHLWDEISGELLAGKRRKRMAAMGWIAAAAVVVVAFLAGWLLNDRSDRVIPSMVEQTEVQTDQMKPAEPQLQTETLKIKDQEEQVLIEKEVQTKSSETGFNKGFAVTLVAENVAKENEALPAGKREEWNIDYLPLKTAEFKRDAETLTTQMSRSQKLSVQNVSPSDEEMIASNLHNLQQEKTFEHGWIVGAHLSPGYAAHTSSYSTSYSGNMGANSEGGVRNVGGGVSVQYKTGKKLRLESGVYYAQNSQSMGSSDALFSMSPNYDYLPGYANLSGSDRVYANVVELQQGGMAMNSTAGVIKISQTPKGSELSAENTTDNALNQATLVTSGEFAQQFDFIEIPMYLRYRIVDSKLGIDLMGGLNAGIVVGNNVYISNQYGKQNVGTTEDISSLNLSGTLGLGLSYAMGRHFSLSLEPRMNYYLNSINTNPDVSYKPYRLGLFTGVYYAF